MKKQKLGNVFILTLLFLLGLIYCAEVFVSDNGIAVNKTITTDTNDDSAGSSEENVKEPLPLFLHEKLPHHFKSVPAISVNLNAYIEVLLPEPYLQLNTPPPDFA